MPSIVMRDVYGQGIWHVYVPTDLPPDTSWLWDPYETNSVCIETGEWLCEKLCLDPPTFIDANERIVVFTENVVSLLDALSLTKL